MRYIGLDAHSKSSTFVVLDERGKETARQIVETNGRALIGFLKLTPGQKALCFKEGTTSQWLFEILSPHVDRTVVAHISEKGRGQKNDGIDARNLAEKLRTNSPGITVFKPKKDFVRLRALVRAYNKLVEDHVTVKNRIKAMFRSWGLLTPGRMFFSESRRTQELARLPRNFKFLFPAVNPSENDATLLALAASQVCSVWGRLRNSAQKPRLQPISDVSHATRGAAIAVFANARKLAALVYRLIRYGRPYVDVGATAYEAAYTKRRIAALSDAANSLGYSLVRQPDASPVG